MKHSKSKDIQISRKCKAVRSMIVLLTESVEISGKRRQ